jgi:hypothetical protein
MINGIRYNKETGDITSTFTVPIEADLPIATDQEGIIIGKADVDNQYIDISDLSIKERVPAVITIDRKSIVADNVDAAILGVPVGCFIEINGTIVSSPNSTYSLSTGTEGGLGISLVGKYKSNTLAARAISIALMRAEAEKEINKIVENTTFEHESNNYAASEESLNKIERFASIYHRLNAVPDGFAWPTFEGTPVTMTLAQFLSLAATAGTHAMTVLNKKIVDIGKVKVATNSQEIKDI